MVLGPFSPDRRRPAAVLIGATTPWANDRETLANMASTCGGLTDGNVSPVALQKVFDMVDASVDVSRPLMIPHPTDRPPETLQRETRQTNQKSLHRVLARPSELAPLNVSLNDILSDSPAGTATSPETLGVTLWSPNCASAYSPWLVPSPSELSVLSPRGDSDTGCYAPSYDANDWPADDSQEDLSPAYDLRNTYTHTACPERIDSSCDHPPLYDRSKWRAFEICVNPPNATWVGATLVGETRDHLCRLIIAETGAEMQLGWDHLSLLASENQICEHMKSFQGPSSSNKLATEAALRRQMTFRTDGPNWQLIAQSMIDDGHAVDAAGCQRTWLELIQRQPYGSLPAEELEKRFWSMPRRRVDLYDDDCWCSGVTVTDASAMAGRSTILLDSGETVTIAVPDQRVRLSLLVPPSSVLDSVRFVPDAVRTAADVTLIGIEGSKTKHCSLRDLVLLLRGRQESRTLQQQAPAMASEQMALDLISMLHPSEVLRGVSIGHEIGATVVSLVGVKKILQGQDVLFDRLRLSQIDTQLIKAMSVTNDQSSTSIRHLRQRQHEHTTTRHSSAHVSQQKIPEACSTATSPDFSVYSGRLRATPQRLDPCQPANQLSAPRASMVTFSEAPPIVKSLDMKAKAARAVIWDTEKQCKITGAAAPLKNALSAYLKDHPNCEVYTCQEKRCVKSSIGVQLASETANSDALTLQEADGSSPRTPATRVSGGAHCPVPTRADHVELGRDSIDDGVTPIVKIACQTGKLAGGACRHRNKPGHLVDMPLQHAGLSEEESKQMSQGEGDEVEQGSEANKGATEGEDLVPTHTQELPMKAPAKSTPVAIVKQSRRPKITRATKTPTVPTACATRSSVAATRQSGESTVEKQLDNLVVHHAGLENEQHNPEKAKRFPSGGAIVPWTKSELDLLKNAVTAQDQNAVDWKIVSAAVGRTADACSTRYTRSKRKNANAQQCPRKRKKS